MELDTNLNMIQVVEKKQQKHDCYNVIMIVVKPLVSSVHQNVWMPTRRQERCHLVDVWNFGTVW